MDMYVGYMCRISELSRFTAAISKQLGSDNYTLDDYDFYSTFRRFITFHKKESVLGKRKKKK